MRNQKRQRRMPPDPPIRTVLRRWWGIPSQSALVSRVVTLNTRDFTDFELWGVSDG